jgi:hypothetical protein
MFHCVPLELERSERRFPFAPVNVRVFVTVCVELAAKVSVSAEDVFLVKL